MHAPRILSLVTTVVLSAAYLYLGTRPQNPEAFQHLSDKLAPRRRVRSPRGDRR